MMHQIQSAPVRQRPPLRAVSPRAEKVETEPPLVLYHANCTDGYGAAYCAWRKFRENAQYMPIQHGEVPTIDALSRLPSLYRRQVLILDFSFERSVMLEIMARARQVIWLDHHKSSFDDWCGKGYLTPHRQHYSESISNAHGDAVHIIELDNTRSGSRMAWDYLFPDEPLPALIAHIEDYDLFRHALPNTELFILGLNSIADWSFQRWDALNEALGPLGASVNEHHAQILYRGEVSASMQRRIVRDLQAEACPILLPSYAQPGLAVCAPALLANDVGVALLDDNVPYVAAWYLQGDGLIKCSLRSTEVDVEQIARQLGGGGHARASAFRATPAAFFDWLR